MILIPSLEIAANRVVQRVDGRVDVLDDDPLAAARALRDRGADFFQLRLPADPDPTDAGVVDRLVEAGLPCVVSAGVAGLEAARAWLERGADRVLVDLDRCPAEQIAGLAGDLGPRLGVELACDAESVEERLRAVVGSGAARVQIRSAAGHSAVDPAWLAAVDRAVGVEGVELFVEAPIRSRDDLAALAERAERGLAGVVLADAYAAVVAVRAG